MTRLAHTLWQDIRRGTGAPVSRLVTGMLAAFIISLPLTVVLTLTGALPPSLVYMLTGGAHGFATFAVAGREMRKAR